MNTLTIVLTLLVAVEHLYIMALETFFISSKSTSRVFNIPQEKLTDKTIATLFKNQGIYNGLLAVLLLVSVWQIDLFWCRLLLSYVIAVAVYGSLTSNPLIILKQGGLAILALIASWLC